MACGLILCSENFERLCHVLSASVLLQAASIFATSQNTHLPRPFPACALCRILGFPKRHGSKAENPLHSLGDAY